MIDSWSLAAGCDVSAIDVGRASQVGSGAGGGAPKNPRRPLTTCDNELSFLSAVKLIRPGDDLKCDRGLP